MRLDYAQATDRGKVRETNEDSHAAVMPDAPSQHLEKGSWFAVADGLGGLPDGEIASREAVSAFREIASRCGRPFSFPGALEELFRHANRRVCSLNAGKAQWLRMATTLTVSLFLKDGLYIGHAGDCRVYRIRENAIRQLTEDQSLDRHTLTQALGMDEGLAPAFYKEELAAGDRYLQCSDGLYGVLSDRTLLGLVARNGLQEASGSLIRAANEAGGPDNITVQLIEITDIINE